MACREAKVDKSSDMATLEMLALATSKMRKVQKEYFRRRTNTLLNEAKAAEAEVDRLLRELAPSNVAIAVDLFEADQGVQTQLFP